MLFWCRTPAYAAPEVFIDPTTTSFQADVWSLTTSLFHLVSGELPFECSTPIIASVNISDFLKPAPDIRDKTPSERPISPSFAAVIAKGLEKNIERRFKSVDEMSTALHRCLVQQGHGVFSIFISPSEFFHDQILAQLLYKSINNQTTAGGNRVFACMRPLQIGNAEAWEDFSLSMTNSLIALPIISNEMIQSLKKLKGSGEDRVHSYLKELILMKILNKDSGCVLKDVIPVLIGPEKILKESSERLVPRESPSTIHTVQTFLINHSYSTQELDEWEPRQSYTVNSIISNLLELQSQEITFCYQSTSVNELNETRNDEDSLEECLLDELTGIFSLDNSEQESYLKNMIWTCTPAIKSIAAGVCKRLDSVRTLLKAAELIFITMHITFCCFIMIFSSRVDIIFGFA